MPSATLAAGHKITIGAAVYSSAVHSRLTGLRIQCDLDVPVNSASIRMSPPDGLSISPDDKVAIELGYDDQLDLVFTGKLDSVESRLGKLILHASGSFRKLAAARFNLAVEKSKAGDVISDVSQRLGLESGDVEDGPEYPSLTLSDSETVYEGLKRIADQCGFDLYADAGDKLVFARYKGDPIHEFQFGVNILSLRVEERTQVVTSVAVYGESPASLGQGADASSWLAKKEISGQAGDSGGLLLRRFYATARTQDMTAQVAEAILAESGTRRVCTLKALGATAVQLGRAIKVSRMPVDSQNGTFKVIGVEHRLDGRNGFVSIVRGVEV